METKIIEVSQDEMVNVYEFGDLYTTYLTCKKVAKGKNYYIITYGDNEINFYPTAYFQVEIVKYVKLWETKRYA